jgi:hypothetical protein
MLEVEPVNSQHGLDIATQKTLEMLIREISALRDEIAELRGAAETKSLENSDRINHGPVARFGLWLERVLRR